MTEIASPFEPFSGIELHSEGHKAKFATSDKFESYRTDFIEPSERVGDSDDMKLFLSDDGTDASIDEFSANDKPIEKPLKKPDPEKIIDNLREARATSIADDLKRFALNAFFLKPGTESLSKLANAVSSLDQQDIERVARYLEAQVDSNWAIVWDANGKVTGFDYSLNAATKLAGAVIGKDVSIRFTDTKVTATSTSVWNLYDHWNPRQSVEVNRRIRY